jgi:tRNA threonylcarbamoyladenosine biosynthesis protein TsaE
MEYTLEELEQYAQEFVAALPQRAEHRAHVVGLRGNLGSGKTTFTQAVARALGVRDMVTSPTFVIAQSYHTAHPVFTRFVHMDAYRLEGEVEDTIGFASYLEDPHTLVFVEWPEHLPRGAHFPEDAPVLQFETVDEHTRRIETHA